MRNNLPKAEEIINLINKYSDDENNKIIVTKIGKFLDDLKDLFGNDFEGYMRTIYLLYGYHYNKNIGGFEHLELLK